jgi:hypothetical protein
MARLSDRFSFIKAFNKNAVEALARNDYDLVYVTYERQFQDAGLSVRIPPPAVIGVRCHCKWDGGRGLPPAPGFLKHLRGFAAVHVPSKILYDIFKDRHAAVFHTPHGVDEKIFRPRQGARHASPAGELVLGWAGSKTNHPGKRGLEDFLLPALDGLAGVTLDFAAREDRWRTQEEMVAFYQGLDACICTSRTEGGPHPLLEASACGIPLISTRVGIAPELIRQYENGILVDRTVAAIREAVVLLRDDKDLRLNMGSRAREIVEQGWTWDRQALKYIPFFTSGLGQ